jgi:2-iminobutanoate/2-iminopropanoate deaminase
MGKEAISTPYAPAAIGPYSQAVAAGPFLFTAGQIGLSPGDGVMAEGVAAQTEQALQNLRAVLAAAGCGLDDVVKATVFLASMNDFGTMNGVYEAHFAAPYPARSALEAARLPKDALVEIEVIALRPTGGG